MTNFDSTTYRVTPRAGEPFELEAESVEHAASLAAPRIAPRTRRPITAWRVTGSPGLSGMFQAYVRIGRGDNWTSAGENFHVG